MKGFQRAKKKLAAAANWSVDAYKKPFFVKSQKSKFGPKQTSWINFSFHNALFGNLPEHYPLHRKLALLKSQSMFGKFWDFWMVALSIYACALYVAQSYISTYSASRFYGLMERVITQFFAADFVFNLLCASNHSAYLTSPWTVVDLVTILPYYITLALSGTRVNLSIFRFVRILRLIRILRTFKLLGGLSGVKKQIITLSLTLTSLVFMAAGVIQIMENDVKQQLEYKCNHIGEFTDWQPSCSPYYLSDDSSCDCVLHNCGAYYNSGDVNGHPSGLRCIRLTFLDCFYYMIVTGVCFVESTLSLY